MTYRDDKDARIERLEAELEEARRTAREHDGRADRLAGDRDAWKAKVRSGQWFVFRARLGAFATFAAVLGAVLVAGYFLATCKGCPADLNAGYVVGHRHRPETTTTTYVKSGNVWIPITSTTPEAWFIDIASGGTDVTVEVDQATYNSARGGQWICVDRPCPPEP